MNYRCVLRQALFLSLAAVSIAGCREVQSSPTAKQALLVIYSQFEEHEYNDSREILEDSGVIVTIASSTTSTLKGHKGLKVNPDILLKAGSRTHISSPP